ncbi:MAG: EAL domain-containing protein [Aquabacterium sp.]|nr:EAL domain-containing protein [Aquabacterium sp.]
MTADLPTRPGDLPLSAAQRAEQRVQLALWASGESVWEWEAASGLVKVDAAEPTALPFSAVEQGMTLEQLFARAHADDQEALRLAWQLHLRGAHPDIDVSFRIQNDAGHQRWLRVRGRALGRDARGQVERVLGTLKDVTAQREAEDSLRLMAHAFSSTRDAMAVIDPQWTVLEINEALVRLAGEDSGIMPGSDLRQWLKLDDAVLAEVLADGIWRGDRELRCAAGDVPVEVSITAVLASDGQRRCHLVALHDLRERRLSEARLQRMAMVDELTGLPNRLAAQFRIDEALARKEPCFGILFIDLDGFKEINDSYGHDHGDQLLAAVGQRLRAALPEDAVLARWGSDEFLVVLAQGSGDTEVRASAQVVLAALASPFEVGDQAVRITPTIGAVLAPQDGLEFSQLLRKADSAMYAGKERGRNCLVFFDSTLDNDAQRRVRLTSLLRIDTDRNGFRFVAQPKVDAQGRTKGAELLMRWTTEAFGSVSPVEFIPLAEKVGLIQLMGRHAAHAAAQLAAACAELGHALPVAVNLSPKQLLQPGLDGLLLHACRRHGIAPCMLELELTESALVHNMDIVAPMLHRLRGHGFSLALDDFGTGYSSLSYLRHLPFDKVKIDRSFVMDIERDPAATRLLESIVKLCKVLGMRTVAEGVETAQQLAALAAMGVDEFQGYYFARPMPVDDWLALLGRPGEPPPLLPLPDAAG